MIVRMDGRDQRHRDSFALGLTYMAKCRGCVRGNVMRMYGRYWSHHDSFGLGLNDFICSCSLTHVHEVVVLRGVLLTIGAAWCVKLFMLVGKISHRVRRIVTWLGKG